MNNFNTISFTEMNSPDYREGLMIWSAASFPKAYAFIQFDYELMIDQFIDNDLDLVKKLDSSIIFIQKYRHYFNDFQINQVLLRTLICESQNRKKVVKDLHYLANFDISEENQNISSIYKKIGFLIDKKEKFLLACDDNFQKYLESRKKELRPHPTFSLDNK
jgi:hypothetical protein